MKQFHFLIKIFWSINWMSSKDKILRCLTVLDEFCYIKIEIKYE